MRKVKVLYLSICMAFLVKMEVSANEIKQLETEWQGKTETVKVDASIICPDIVYRGSLVKDNIQNSVLELLFGKQELWILKEKEEDSYGDSWIYSQAPISCWIWDNNLTFEVLNQSISSAFEYDMLFEENSKLQPEEIIENINGLISIGELNECYQSEYDYLTEIYNIQGVIEGVKISDYCTGRFGGTVSITNGKISNLNLAHLLKLNEKERIEILPLEDIFEKARYYIENGFINAPPSKEAITSIELKYYVEVFENECVFTPVWAFHVLNFWGEEDINKMHEMFCLDACTAEIVSYKGV